MRTPRLLLAAALTLGGLLVVPAAAAPDPSCSWIAKTEPDTVNVAFPDTNASYWSHPYAAVGGTELVVRGTFPKARYFSFNIYQPTAVPIDSIYDAQLRPDKGTGNPFAGSKRGGTYTLRVVFTDKPAKPTPNTLYAGRMALRGLRNPGGILMLRVYSPPNPASPTGGVPLPTVETRTSSGTTLQAGTACSNDLPQTGGALTRSLNEGSVPQDQPATKGTISWGRAYGNNAAGFFANQQNAYLSAGIDRVYGPLVVIRTKAPRFPNTQKGIYPSSRDQVRYWSFCQNSLTTRVNSCAADSQTVVAKDGYITIVISDPAQRPKNAVSSKGVTWIPWGSSDEKGLVLYRHMTPAKGFAQAVQRVDEGEDPVKVMGAYYPNARYCTKTAFESRGWNGCLEI
jgi:hypothetical protein